MMRSKFWQGLMWGGILGTVVGAIIGPAARPQKKPLVERSTDAIRCTTRNLMREARLARKRLIKKMD
ncbi:Hypothetical protein LUCI_1237 [Lucifera butyrica]|uniref:YtxH domain-containing protein n=1 Tax=Lucifera butyrica TaxID=1351585 RepID=A0A498R0J3_9FIRM|nr:hypothetical protein [Lucifera butyrica]VBB06026.1 Hypothetical protein LUCI_1237 [Lucifera butyrica]